MSDVADDLNDDIRAMAAEVRRLRAELTAARVAALREGFEIARSSARVVHNIPGAIEVDVPDYRLELRIAEIEGGAA